jgi:hypothetical protein
MEGQGHIGLLGRGFHLDSLGTHLCGLGAGFAGRHCPGRYLAVGGLRPCQHLCRVHITRNHYSSIGGGVPPLVKATHFIGRERLDVGHPPDDRAAVGVRLPHGGIHRFMQG